MNGNQSSGVVQDKNGKDLKTFTKFRLDSFSADENPPQLEEAYLEDGQVFLEFDELISPGKIKGSRIKLYVGRKKYKVQNAILQDADTEVSFILKKSVPIDSGKITLSYKYPKRDQDSGVIQDEYGNDFTTIKNFPVDLF